MILFWNYVGSHDLVMDDLLGLLVSCLKLLQIGRIDPRLHLLHLCLTLKLRVGCFESLGGRQWTDLRHNILYRQRLTLNLDTGLSLLIWLLYTLDGVATFLSVNCVAFGIFCCKCLTFRSSRSIIEVHDIFSLNF